MDHRVGLVILTKTEVMLAGMDYRVGLIIPTQTEVIRDKIASQVKK
jgi:hypothetical protein